MSDIKKESPLVGRTEAIHGASCNTDAGVTLRERPFLGHISLRGKSDDDTFAAACAKALGLALPMTANTCAEGDGMVICWMGPTEWLLITDGDTCQGWADHLRQALDGVHAGVVDLSGGQTLIEVRGRHAVDTLSKGATLDLHSRSFGAGQCTRTLIAHTTAFIRAVEPGQAFDIVVRRSFADHLWRWLCDAGEEYGCDIQPPEAALDSNDRQPTVPNHDTELPETADTAAAQMSGGNA